ncbi:MAG: hypothetical protein ACHQCI_03075 [Solirubrobacterales bacterium]|jgi:hypothetical protein
MTRLTDSISTPAVKAEKGSFHIDRLAALAIGTLLLIGALAFTAFALSSLDATPATTAQNAAAAIDPDRLVDGWQLSREQPAPVVVDGWAIAREQPTPVVVDGWQLTREQPTPVVVDGWQLSGDD